MACKRCSFVYYLLLMLSLVLSGCAGSIQNMRKVPPGKVMTAPEKGKSMVVFMRPSGMAFGIQSSVFDVNGDTPSLVGIVAAKAKVSYQLEPGKHVFMIVSESSDFMSADLKADKTYYALITPRPGVWKARFSLRPVHANEINTTKYTEWLDGCQWVEKSPESDSWAKNNMPDIKAKREKYYKEWEGKYGEGSNGLLPEDGK